MDTMKKAAQNHSKYNLLEPNGRHEESSSEPQWNLMDTMKKTAQNHSKYILLEPDGCHKESCSEPQ